MTKPSREERRLSDPVDWHRLTINRLACKENDASYLSRSHFRNFQQWYCVLNGSVIVHCDGVDIPLKAQDAILIPPRMNRQFQAAGKPVRYFYTHFHADHLNLSLLAAQPMHLPTELHADMIALAREAEAPGRFYPGAMTHALFVRILISLYRKAAFRTGDDRSRAGGRIEEVVAHLDEFMRRNLHRPLSRRDFAAAANLSHQHLAQIVKAATGQTLGQRLRAIRLEHACELLLETSIPVTHIAIEVGFTSFSYFTQLFRRQIGVPPSIYRKNGGRLPPRSASES